MVAHIAGRKGSVIGRFAVAEDNQFREGGDAESIDQGIRVCSQQRSVADETQ